MIWIALVMAAVGIFLSAFFSGSETGFYRATRVRLVLDALGGDPVSRGLVWLTNHPLLFVATMLVGNNLANYLTSFAVVMGTQALHFGRGHTAELIAPLVLSPVLFVYGELLPKDLFLQAPNRLLRRGGPLILTFVVLLFPVSVLLWGLNKLVALVVGESPEEVRLTLVRRELRRVLEEGHEAGILHPAQRGLARGIFAVAGQPVGGFVTPLEKLPRARSDMTRQEVLRLAQRYQIALVPVESAEMPGKLVGYISAIELELETSTELSPIRELPEIREDTPHVVALMQMHSTGHSLVRVVNAVAETLGIVTADGLREPLLARRSAAGYL